MAVKKPGTALVAVVLFVLFVIFLVPKLVHIFSLRDRSQNLEIELKKLRIENTRLENELRLLREDPVYLEKVARQKFNKVKEGEIVYKVVRDAPAESKS